MNMTRVKIDDTLFEFACSVEEVQEMWEDADGDKEIFFYLAEDMDIEYYKIKEDLILKDGKLT